MLFISMAMQSEAAPFISELGLRKNHGIKRLRVYDSSNCVLVITGTGKIRSAAATASVLTHFHACEHDFWANIGVCGSACRHISQGSAAIINKITDHDTGDEMFADMIYAHDFRECALETFSVPVTVDNRTIGPDLVDMEAAAALEAARIFLPPHRTAVIKVILDYLAPRTSTMEDISKVMACNSKFISSWLLQTCYVASSAEYQPSPFAKHENKRDGDIQAKLRFTKAMQVEYAIMARYTQLTGNPGRLGKTALDASCSDDTAMTRKKSREIFKLMKRKISRIPVPVAGT